MTQEELNKIVEHHKHSGREMNVFGEWHEWMKEFPSRDMEGQTMLVSNGESYSLCDWCEGGCWSENPFHGLRFKDEIVYWAELPDIPRR